MSLRRFISVIIKLKNRDYIPKLPRGFLANPYHEDNVTAEQWRVLHRIGSRDPAGIKKALKDYDVDNIDQLIELLHHHKPSRNIKRRLRTAFCRLIGEYDHDPHALTVKRAFKREFEDKQYIKIRERIKNIRDCN